MADEKQIVTFRLSSDRFGVDIMKVLEVISLRDISVRQWKNMPPYIEGFFYIRQRFIPLISLHQRLGLSPQSTQEHDALETALTILIGDQPLAFRLDDLEGVLTIPEDKILAPPQVFRSVVAKRYIEGLYEQSDGSYLILIDIDEIFEVQDIREIKKIQEQQGEG